jgi:hypothetical protein
MDRSLDTCGGKEIGSINGVSDSCGGDSRKRGGHGGGIKDLA